MHTNVDFSRHIQNLMLEGNRNITVFINNLLIKQMTRRRMNRLYRSERFSRTVQFEIWKRSVGVKERNKLQNCSNGSWKIRKLIIKLIRKLFYETDLKPWKNWKYWKYNKLWKMSAIYCKGLNFVKHPSFLKLNQKYSPHQFSDFVQKIAARSLSNGIGVCCLKPVRIEVNLRPKHDLMCGWKSGSLEFCCDCPESDSRVQIWGKYVKWSCCESSLLRKWFLVSIS